MVFDKAIFAQIWSFYLFLFSSLIFAKFHDHLHSDTINSPTPGTSINVPEALLLRPWALLPLPRFTGFEKKSGALEMIACDGDEKRRLGFHVAKIHIGS